MLTNQGEIILITGPLLKEMINESYSKIKTKMDYLNDINVFPVPDCDTGLNILITMEKILEEINKNETLNIKNVSQSIAKGAFMGAKGNSGVILSQFFVGFSHIIEEKSGISVKTFAMALTEGSTRAYKSVMDPKDGTILSVIKDTATAATEKANSNPNWRETLQYCYEVAQQSTIATENQLKDLQKAGVVDAGALGFVYIFQGWVKVILQHLNNPDKVNIHKELENLQRKIDPYQKVADLQYRFCTEGMITNVTEDFEGIKSTLQSYGDSFLLIEDEDNLKMHIHCNTPKDVLDKFSSYGKIRNVKIDDLKVQTMNSHSDNT